MPIHAQFTGRLTSDPELGQLPDGNAVATFRLAVDGLGRRGATGFVTVISYGASGKAAAERLSSGRLVEVVGRFEHSEWEADDGSRRERLQVVGVLHFLRGAGASSKPNGGDAEPAPEDAGEEAEPQS